MSQTYECEVAVVGGGPAGTTVAMELARGGVNVLLLERDRVPRHKCCAGGVTAAARELLPVDISAVVECEVNRVRVSSVGSRHVSWGVDEPFMFTLSRERLDAALWSAALDAGARALDSHRVVRVEDDGHGVVLECETCEVHALAVVGADGAAGIIGRQMGLGRPRHVAVGVALELERPDPTAGCSGEMAELVLGVAPGSYGWIFPMTDRLSVGIECHNARVDRAAALQKIVAHAGLSEARVIRRCV
ncbi:MAG: NAD(P)/FAD-dependent oxidoreductase, partial [Chloroflexi bacterium]|nr:NAD(P)/FAD-dependent oxidoreductase [Chloroflexota bacterium]